MNTAKTVDNYLMKHPNWETELNILRALLQETDLEECIKWGAPCYTYNNQNVIGMMGFKNYVGIWFHQGVFLKDDAGILMNAQEGKTKALRQWRFSSAEEIDPALVRVYINEATDNAKAGRKISPAPPKSLTIPVELQELFDKDPDVKSKFKGFKPGQQREFADYITEAKRHDTKIRRLEKITPMIQAGTGLNDKYK